MGTMGVALAVAYYWINKISQDHKDERKEWHEASQRRTDEVRAVVDTNTRALTHQTATMERLCEDIKDNKCRAHA